MKHYAPNWLSPEAKAIYKRMRKQYGSLTTEQEELVAMAANEYCTYTSANEVLQDLCNDKKSVINEEVYKLQREAQQSYVRLRRQLRISLKDTPATEDTTDDQEEFPDDGF